MRGFRWVVAVATLTAVTLTTGGAADARPGSSCARPGLLFCEDFDRLPTGGAASLDWGVDTKRGALTIRKQHRGKALHVRTVDNGRAFLRIDDLAPPAEGFWGRVRLRVAAFPTAPDWAHFTLVEITGGGSSEVVRPVGGQYVPSVDRSLWGIGADGGPTGDWTAWTETAPATAGAWQCVEWHWQPTGNRLDVWIAGTRLTASETEHGGADVPFVLPRAETVKIGWQLYQGGTVPGGFDVDIDDIALSPARLGC